MEALEQSSSSAIGEPSGNHPKGLFRSRHGFGRGCGRHWFYGGRDGRVEAGSDQAVTLFVAGSTVNRTTTPADSLA
jgi:hypothetical protein